jgi:predicted transposase YdaD
LRWLDDKMHMEGVLDYARQEGREERNLENARRMLAKGFSIDVISDITELTPAEVEALR